jgi:hypothetical protein
MYLLLNTTALSVPIYAYHVVHLQVVHTLMEPIRFHIFHYIHLHYLAEHIIRIKSVLILRAIS